MSIKGIAAPIYPIYNCLFYYIKRLHLYNRNDRKIYNISTLKSYHRRALEQLASPIYPTYTSKYLFYLTIEITGKNLY